MTTKRLTKLLISFSIISFALTSCSTNPVRISDSKTTPSPNNIDINNKGKTTINASVGNVVTSAVGKDAKATSNIGTISGSTIDGKTTINANVGTAVTIAAGKNATAALEVGTIRNAKIKGDTTINAKVGNAVTTAIGKNTCAETRVGAIGKRRCDRGETYDVFGSLNLMSNAAKPRQTMVEPPFFPNPPPAPTISDEVSSNFTIDGNLKIIDVQIRTFLISKGYDRLHYFSFNDGFAVITNIERFSSDGLSANQSRWVTDRKTTAKSFFSYISSLLTGEKGRFRLFVFFVSSIEPRPENYLASKKDVERWNLTGDRQLSKNTGSFIVSRKDTKVWLFVYEFEGLSGRSTEISAIRDDYTPIALHKSALGLK